MQIVWATLCTPENPTLCQWRHWPGLEYLWFQVALYKYLIMVTKAYQTLQTILSRFNCSATLHCHHTSTITTDSNRSPMLSPRHDLPGFWPCTEIKVWLLQTWVGIAPANMLVFLTWLLWAVRSFRRFTLHYNTLPKPNWNQVNDPEERGDPWRIEQFKKGKS